MKSGSVYLVRHGQAGSRQNYDALSELGQRQAAELGAYFARTGLQFATWIAGGLERQQSTARIAASASVQPALQTDARWSEFDLDEVYRGIAPQLAAQNPAFAREYEDLQRKMLEADSHVHRSWTSCDVSVFMAWIDGAISFDGETFAQFTARVQSAWGALADVPKPAAVFSSATPISLVLGWIQHLGPLAFTRFAGEMWNGAYSVVEMNEGVRLSSFNEVPHLTRELCTKR